MQVPSFGFCGPGYLSQAKVFSAERSINLYVEQGGGGAHPASNQYLVATPGTQLFTTLPTGPVRAIFAGDNRLFAIGGTILYEIFSNGGTSQIGIVADAPTPAQIFSNGNSLFVISGLKGYYTDGTKPIGDQLVEVPGLQPVTGGYIEGFLAVQEANSNRWRISNLLDATTWDPLDFGVKIGGSDRLCAIFVDHDEVWLIGFRTTEVWYLSGSGNFPFSKIQGAFIEQGCAAPFSVVKLDNSMFWLGGDDRGAGVVWRMQGYTPTRVSNYAVEYAIQRYPSITDAVAVSYQYLGHSFYELHFPSANACWVYDVATNMWHERLRWVAAEGAWKEHPCRFHAFGNFPLGFPAPVAGQSSGRHYVGDCRNGNIYVQSVDFLDNAFGPGGQAEPKRWLRSSPHLVDALDWIYHEQLIFNMQTGGDTSVPGGQPAVLSPFLDAGGIPKVYLRVSDDGGNTWSTNVREQSAGRIGQYRYRVVFRQLGRSLDRCYELSGSDPVPVAIVEANLRAFFKARTQ